jgi:hypothetical protein
MSIKKIIGIILGAVVGFLLGYLGKCAAPGGVG